MKNNLTTSLSAFWTCVLFLTLVSFIYYPKWKMPMTEATLSWDVSGYYFYLPAFLIYKDAKKLEFKDEILGKYRPTWNLQQAYLDEASGNYVMKYSSGLAVQYLPFFGIAHAFAGLSDQYEADGFSLPYQAAISWGSLLVAFIGLWFLRKVLLRYFKDKTVAITLLIIVFGTNYLDYSAINGAMTHNYLFTLYALLIWRTIKFYENPTHRNAAVIGAIIGLMALTRPTEILACLIPLLWLRAPLTPKGWEGNVRGTLRESNSQAHTSLFSSQEKPTHPLGVRGARNIFLKTHASKYLLAAVITLAVGSIQLFYWKYATGNWIVYSYGEQGFSWFSPHFEKGIFGFQSGWLIYTPIMALSLIGFYFLYKKHRRLFPVMLLFSVLFIWITFAWDEWLYGGGLGIRAMVQGYVVLAFPLAAFLENLFFENAEKSTPKRVFKWGIGIVCLLFCYYNLWLTHQAHLGELLKPGAMTKAYLWKILGKYEVEEGAVKLLDTDEEFTGVRKDVSVIYENDFEADSLENECPLEVISGKQSICLNKEIQFSPVFNFSISNNNFDWLRASADFRIEHREFTIWRMTQFIIRLKKGDKKIKEKSIRVHRLLEHQDTKNIFFDIELPRDEVDNAEILFWNGEGRRPILIDNLKVELFN